MKETEKCECGKSSVTFKVVGEDHWMHILDNATVEENDGLLHYFCNSCGEEITYADRYMIVRNY